MRKKHRLARAVLVFLCLLLLMPAGWPTGAEAASSGWKPAKGEKLPSWAEEEIKELGAEGIIRGYADGLFKPERTVTRDELLTLLLRLDGSKGSVQNEELASIVKEAITNKVPFGAYDGKKPATRQEAAYFIGELLQLGTDSNNNQAKTYRDGGRIPEWADEAVQAVSSEEWLQGYEDGTFRGEAVLTRAQAAVIIYRIWEWMQERKLHLMAAHVSDQAGMPLQDAVVTTHEKGKQAVSRWGRTNALGLYWTFAPYGKLELNGWKGTKIANEAATFSRSNRLFRLEAGEAAIIQGKLKQADGQHAAGYAAVFTTNPTFFAVTGPDGGFRAYVLPNREYELTLIEDQVIQNRLETAGTPDNVLGYSDIPASLKLIGKPKPQQKECDCQYNELQGTIKAPAAGETLNLGTFSFTDTRVPGGGQPGPSTVPTTGPTATATPTATVSPSPTATATATATSSPNPSGSPTPSTPTGLAGEAFNASVALSWSANGAAGYRVYRSMDGGATWDAGTDIGASASRTVTGLSNGTTYAFAVTAYNTAGSESPRSASITLTPAAGEVQLPPDPATIAEQLPLTGPATMADMSAFLYEGEDPIQSGVATGAIELDRIAVLRGKVLDADNRPLPGVKVSVLGHGELGQTYTRADGMFDLAVNGGGELTVEYEREGFMEAQRKIETNWEEFEELPDVTLLAYDTKVTTIGLNGSGVYQVAQSSPVSDADGTRQGTLIVPPGTSATMKLPDGTERWLPEIHFRATEYTVGENGLSAMPGELPSFVGYTYAVELSADEAIEADATEVTFSKPLYYYVDNFLEFPVGETVPIGYYDREAANWVPSDNGVIIGIVDTAGGMASVDVDGDGAADDGAELTAIGMTEEERVELAKLYSAGKSLWRVPIAHFTPWDCNWPYGPPADAINPPNREPRAKIEKEKDPCPEKGSIIGCQDQSLGERLPVAGTNLDLMYQSKRTEGYADKSSLDIPLSDDTELPDSLRSISATVRIAGRTFTRSFAPQPNLSYTFQWDGRDAYGRMLVGSQPYEVTVDYHWNIQYYASPESFQASFARLGDTATVIGSRGLQTIRTSKSWEGALVSPANPYEEAGIGGWSFDNWHVYDPDTNMLTLGDGRFRILPGYMTDAFELRYKKDPSAAESAVLSQDYGVSDLIVGGDGKVTFTANKGYSGRVELFQLERNGAVNRIDSFANKAWFEIMVDDADNLYSLDISYETIYRKKPSDLQWTRIAGIGNTTDDYSSNLDGKIAVDTDLIDPRNLEMGPDGSLYFIDYQTLHKLDPDGVLTALGARDTWGTDSGAATKTNIGNVTEFQFGADGSIYLLDSKWCNSPGCYRSRIRELTPEGTLTHIAGDVFTTAKNISDGIKATEAVFYASDLVVGPNGELYFVEPDQNKLYTITPDGILQEVLSDFMANVQRKVVNENGATGGKVPISLLGIGPEGEFYMGVQHRNTKGGRLFYRVDASHYRIPSEDGMQIYEFDQETGRHVMTRSALTGVVETSFGYDAEGRLISVTDRYGNVTAVERNAQGDPTAIVAPGGQRTSLSLSDSGELASIVNPAGEAFAMTYGDGLLTELTNPKQETSRYRYDELGFLVEAVNAKGGVKTLERSIAGNAEIVTFTDPNGRATRYETSANEASTVHTTTDSSGYKTVTESAAGRTETATLPDGTVIRKTFGIDPRWGRLTPYVTQLTYTSPDGTTTSFQEQRSAVMDASGMLQSYTVRHTVNGDISTIHYDAAADKFTQTTAEGVVTETYLNAKDQVARVAWPGTTLHPIEYAYDGAGRIERIVQGEKFVAYTYNAQGLIEKEEDAHGSVKSYTYDEAGRILSVTTPGSKTYGQTYDELGQLTGLTMPDGSGYGQTYNALGQFEGFGPQESAPWTESEYDHGGSITESRLASGRTVSHVLETEGGRRPIAMNDADILRTFSYEGSSDFAAAIVSAMPADAARNQSIAYGYSGENVSSMELSGKVNASFAYDYDDFFNLTAMNMTIGDTVASTAMQYDRDDNLTRYGPFQFARSGPLRAVGSMSDGAMDIRLGYDEYGKLASTAYVLQGNEVYREEYAYDLRGFVTDVTIRSASGTETVHYDYDADGQLTGVTRTDGGGVTTTEAYAYDVNKNRVSSQLGAAEALTSTYGNNGVLQQVGDVAYVFDADGYMTARGADAFRYGARGELLEATISGVTYKYTYDGLGRRVAKDDGEGRSTGYVYGNPEAPNLLTASVAPDGAVTQYYYNEMGLLIGMETAGTRYYVIADAVGTPSKVLDTGGALVKELRYDGFGRLLSDSNPAFELVIGYAGGIEDRDTGLVRFGARDYDPLSGRWTARDPLLLESGQANMYAYVNNNPIMFRDPCGQFCVGGSVYSGVGGGGKVCISHEGVSACAEVGFGVGGGTEISPFEGISKNELTMEITGKATLGVVNLTAGYKFAYDFDTGCRGDGIIAKAEAGPFSYDAMSPEESAVSGENDSMKSKVKDLLKKNGFKAEAAVKTKFCRNLKW
ncbi:S-layer homology domain-containing protein [Paenibacillus soyae]|uniref:S-layer homology domain-containing protein n=1 Tax=Paenibacillus soyae TaxID=2969249 RepID=A0A9X2MT20_9BACL|nr:S-layer homology domain-containing protein [Paenibacillus soyae]MCR2805935.1 S-layer homology domain-containing protein [Paenibacillus soyae]